MGAVQNFVKRIVSGVPERGMKETRTDIPASFYDSRNPWSVTSGSDCLHLSDASAKMLHDAAELFWTLRDETGLKRLRLLANQALNLGAQFLDFSCVQTNLSLTLD
jgi:hypothetical protein